jgi:hypothetical protein
MGSPGICRSNGHRQEWKMGALPGSENALTPGLQLSGRMEAADTAVHDVPLLLYWKTPPEGWCEKLKTM